MQKKSNFDSISARLRMLYNSGNIKELVEKMGIKRSTYDGWRNKGSLPDARLYKIIEEKGVNVDWLLYGKEPKYRVDIIEQNPLIKPYIEEIVKLFKALPESKKDSAFAKVKRVLIEELS